jgi:hypothetical protein
MNSGLLPDLKSITTYCFNALFTYFPDSDVIRQKHDPTGNLPGIALNRLQDNCAQNRKTQALARLSGRKGLERQAGRGLLKIACLAP